MINALPVKDKDKWETPDHIFDKLNKEFHFTLDPCCEIHTAKCKKFYTIEDNGLNKNWQGEIVFCNPPYSSGNIDKWIKKCYEESLKPKTTVVALTAVSGSAKWWHSYVINRAEKRYIERRVKFIGARYTAPFSSVILVFGGSGIKSFSQ